MSGYKGLGGGTHEVSSVSLRARTSRANPLIAKNSASVMYKKAVVTSLSSKFRLETICRSRPCVPRKNRYGTNKKMHELVSMGTKKKAIRFVREPCFNDADEVEDMFFCWCVCVLGLPATCDRFLDPCFCRMSGYGVCDGLDACAQRFVMWTALFQWIDHWIPRFVSFQVLIHS